MKIISYDNGLRVLFYSLVLASFPCSALARAHASPSGEAYFQQTISGTVSDSSGSLPGVVVMVKDTTRSTISDADGKFSITASAGDVLIFSFTGYKTVEVIVGAQSVLSITLQEDATQLEELEINAGYYSVKKKESTGSISRITAKDIETQPVTNVLATMQGRLAGVNITQTTGVPGGGFNVQIRGLNSLRTGANEPLYVIDGVPYSSEVTGSAYTSTLYPTATSPLNSLNPDAIASIEVLKDADATSIYGSRGANGVVLITTKKGSVGKTQFHFNASHGAGQVTRFMKLMNTGQYLDMRTKAFANDGFTQYPDFAYDVNGTWDPGRYTDWQKELVGGTAEITALQGTLSGGSEQTQFLVGGNYRSESTVFPGDFMYRKTGAFLNLSHQSLNGKFKINFSANYVVQNNDQPASDLTIDSRRLAPNAPALYDNNGNLNWANSTWTNPLSYNEAVFKFNTNDLTANTNISYALAKGLQAKVSFGYNNTQHEETRTTPSTIYDPAYGLGSEYSVLFLNTTARHSWIAEPQLSYDLSLGEHRIGLLAGGSFQQQQSGLFTAFGQGFASNSLIYNLAAASYKEIALDDTNEYKYQAFFGRVNYNYKGKYILNLTGRRDGSSRFSPENRFSTFGAVGAAWVFSKESIWGENTPLSFGKLRASYGTTGSDQIGEYQFLDTYTLSGSVYQGIVGLRPSRLYNPDFGWESNRKLEAALEFGFLRDRIMFSASWYRNRSSNQLVGVPLPATTGFSSLQANLDATVQNSGWEFSLNTVNFNQKDFTWITNFNLTAAKNKLLEFPGLEGSTYANRYRMGQPTNIALTYHYTGLDTQTGLYQFEDVNGDGQITAPEDKQAVVDLNPKFFGGIQNRITYKQWSLDFLFQFVKQKNFAFSMSNGGLMTNQPDRLVNSWSQPGDAGPYQVLTVGLNQAALNSQTQYDSSDANIVDASYIRLKNIAVSYELQLKSPVGCTITAQAQNLLTFTPYKDGDPEFSSAGYLPPLRVISLGIQLKL